MILVDTSAWIEFDRATNSSVDHRLTTEVANGGNSIACTDPVIMEVLAGARSPRHLSDLRAMLTRFQWIPVDVAADFEGAASIYRDCRKAGVTPRGFVDCMIANIAIRTGSTLLAVDTDFRQMATVVPLQLLAQQAG